MDKVRFGIVGFGTQGSTYAAMMRGKSNFPGMPPVECPAYVQLGAICDIDPAAEKRAAELYPDVPFFNDYQVMIDSGEVDAVITTLPHYFHPEVAIYAIEQGVAALVDKPAGVFAKAVKEMNEVAAKHPDIAYGIVFNQRTNKLYQKLREIVQSGELGKLRRSNWIINTWWRPDSYYQQSEWRATWGGEGGGVVMNQAPHQLDLWQWICGLPKAVSAKVVFGAHRDIIVDNDVTVVADYGDGATGVFITATHDILGTDRLEIDLDAGKIVVENSKTATIYRFNKSEQEMNESMSMMDVAMLMRGGGIDKLAQVETFENSDGWGTQHMTVIANFADHILRGTELLAPGSDGIYGVELANAILLSAWLGMEVDIPVDPDIYLDELNHQIELEGKYDTINLPDSGQ